MEFILTTQSASNALPAMETSLRPAVAYDTVSAASAALLYL